MQTGGARMWLMAGVVAGLCGGGCYDEDPTGPRRLASPAAQVLVTADTACVRARFDLTGPTTVQTQFPERTDCAASLVLIRAQPAQWAQSPNRQLRVFVRILNTSGGAIQLPVRLYLPTTGTTVDVPAGTPASKVVPLNADSTDAGGGKIWFLGGTSVLAVGDSTALDTLGFNVQSPVDQARWQFQATAMSADTARPPIPPTSWPVSPLVAASPADTANVYYRNVIGLLFDDSTAASAISLVLVKYQAVVIGGSPLPAGTGEYYVELPDPGPTLSAVDSVISLVAAEPGVRRVTRLSLRLRMQFRGRYPNDGTFSTRADWFRSPAPVGTSPRLLVRAPLAWGCENGRYETQRVRVGILDATFEDRHPDLDTANVELFPLPDGAVLTPFSDLSGPQNASNRAHGTGVAGVLAAVGDNGTGVAGMLWSADLNLYHYGVDSAFTNAPELRFEDALRAAASAGTRVLTTSIAFGDASDPGTVARLRDALAFFLQDPNSLFVIANGNDALHVPLSQVATPSAPQITALDRAVAELYSSYGNRIVFAAGSANSNSLWASSNVWVGATALAAPATFVLSLGRPGEPEIGFPAGTRVFHGTSFAAPFIAGTAAALLAMEPALTGAEVKDYLLRGALMPRVDTASGVATIPSPLTGASGVYQLDAYGALSLLSRERPGTPICGFPVEATTTHILLHRGVAPTESIPAPAGQVVVGVSVAQGGRLVSGDVFDPALSLLEGTVALWEHSASGWVSRPSPAGYVKRLFLETDTAYVTVTYPPSSTTYLPLLTIKRADGTQDPNLDLYSSRFPAGAKVFPAFWAMSLNPTGTWGTLDVQYDQFGGCGGSYQDLVSIPGNIATRVAEAIPQAGCGLAGSFEGHTAWNPSGLEAVIGSDSLALSTGVLSRYQLGPTVTRQAQITLPSRYVGRIRYLPGVPVLATHEVPAAVPGPCTTEHRSATTLAHLATANSACPDEFWIHPNLRGTGALLARRMGGTTTAPAPQRSALTADRWVQGN